MRKLLNEFFYVPKYGKGKIREKVMLARTALTVAIMVVCLAAMGITAYAYFAYNVTSASNHIQAAKFETKVSIQIGQSNNEPVTVEQVNAQTQVATLSAGKEYSVTIEKTGTAQTGFCVISAKNCEIEKYHTQQIGKDVRSNTEGKNTITFTLTVTDTTDVTFYSHWGTSTQYADYEDKGKNDVLYILDGETVNLSINGITNSGGNENGEKKAAQTTPPATETTTPPSVATEPSAPPTTTEPAVTEPPATKQTEPSQATTQQAETTATEETQPVAETTGVPTTETNG